MGEKSSLEARFPAEFGQPAGMSREQYNYAVAKALYEVRQEAADVEVKRLPTAQVDLKTDKELDEFVGQLDAVYERHRVGEARELLKVAEDGLIDWAEGSMREKYGKRFEQVAVAFTRGREARPELRGRLVDLCFRWREGE